MKGGTSVLPDAVNRQGEPNESPEFCNRRVGTAGRGAGRRSARAGGGAAGGRPCRRSWRSIGRCRSIRPCASGRLPNGLRYFIRQNSRPANRVSMRLAVNVGVAAGRARPARPRALPRAHGVQRHRELQAGRAGVVPRVDRRALRPARQRLDLVRRNHLHARHPDRPARLRRSRHARAARLRRRHVAAARRSREGARRRPRGMARAPRRRVRA